MGDSVVFVALTRKKKIKKRLLLCEVRFSSIFSLLVSNIKKGTKLIYRMRYMLSNLLDKNTKKKSKKEKPRILRIFSPLSPGFKEENKKSPALRAREESERKNLARDARSATLNSQARTAKLRAPPRGPELSLKRSARSSPPTSIPCVFVARPAAAAASRALLFLFFFYSFDFRRTRYVCDMRMFFFLVLRANMFFNERLELLIIAMCVSVWLNFVVAWLIVLSQIAICSTAFF